MAHKLFLTSFIAMGIVANAYAEPTNTGDFPQNGLMQEDYTYTNAATETNMDGVYEGTVNATAEYENILYQLAAGQYLPANSETPIDCDQNGYYCAGDNNGVNYSDVAQGLTQCPSGYTNSDAGAQSSDQCYRSCSGNVTMQHATGVTGNDYYGNGTDTCAPTGCDHGYHVKPATPDLTNIIGTDAGASNAYIDNNGQFDEHNAAHGQSYYGINGNNTWAVGYGTKGILIGQGRCSTQAGDNNGNTWTNPTITSNLTDETGQTGARYCYCNVTGYKDTNGNLQSVSSPWVFNNDRYEVVNCAYNCAALCASNLWGSSSAYLSFRAAVLGSVSPSQAMCEANTININWSDADAADISANNAGTATYGSDIRTPRAAAVKPGKRFVGWRFAAPTSVQSCDNITDQSTCTNNNNCSWDYGSDTCVQSCESITDSTTCMNRGTIFIPQGQENYGMDTEVWCLWKNNNSCEAQVESYGGSN